MSEFDRAKQQIEDLKKQLELLTKKRVTIIDPNSITTLEKAREAINILNSAISETLRKQSELEEGFGGIYRELTEIVGEMSRMNSAAGIVSKNFKGIQSIAQQLKYDQQDLSKLDEKQLKSLQKRLKQKQEEILDQSEAIKQQYRSLALNARGEKVSEAVLKRRLKAAGITQKEFATIQAMNSALEEQAIRGGSVFTVFDDINDALQDRIKFEKESNDLLGISYGLSKGLESSLNKLGFGNLAAKLGFNEANEAMKDMADKIAESNENLRKQKDIQSQIDALNTRGLSEKQMAAGFGGKALKDLVAQKAAIGSTANAASGLGATMKILGQGAKVFASNLQAALGPAALIAMALEQLTEALKAVDSGAGDMAKKMNLTYEEAVRVHQELSYIGGMSGDVALTTKGLAESYMAIGQSLGSNALASEKTLITFTKLREQAGYTNEQLTELNKLSLVNGKSLEDNTKEILGSVKAYASQKRLILNEKQVLDDVVKASASIKLSLGGSADALAKAAVQARSIGLSLEQTDKVAQSLLQFETSIENELSAELLLGKDLNFENARRLALNNDIAGAAEEVAKQVGTSADFAKMNRIQQEAIAKAAGLTRDELAQSLMDREALAKLSGVEGKTAQEKFNNLVKEVGLEEAKKRLGDEQLANQFAQQSVQERFTQAVEKLKEVFIQIAEPILSIVSPLMDLVSTVLPAINFLLQPLLVGFQTIAGWVATFVQGLRDGSPAAIALAAAIGLIAFPLITSAIGAIFTTFSQIPFGIGIPLAIASVVGLFSMLAKGRSEAKKGNDILSPPSGGGGYGKRTLFGPEGAIQLNDKDTIVATTNPIIKGNDVASPGKNSSFNSDKSSKTMVVNSSPTKPEPDSNRALLFEMKRGNDLREQQIKRDKNVSFVRIQ